MSIKKDHVIITSDGKTKEEGSMFSGGQINAKSLKDALAILTKYAKLLEENDSKDGKKDDE